MGGSGKGEMGIKNLLVCHKKSILLKGESMEIVILDSALKHDITEERIFSCLLN